MAASRAARWASVSITVVTWSSGVPISGSSVYGLRRGAHILELKRWLDEPSASRTSEFEAMVKVFFSDAGQTPARSTSSARHCGASVRKRPS